MKTLFLFPNKFKTIGWILFVPAIMLTIIISILEINTDEILVINVVSILETSISLKSSFFSIIKNGVVDEILTITMIIGGLLIGFSKLKNEDEYISKIRYESLVWATYLNYAIILFLTVFMYGMVYLNVLFYNMFTLLLFFIIRFHYIIYKLNKSSNDDE